MKKKGKVTYKSENWGVENVGIKSWWQVGILSMVGLTDKATQTTFDVVHCFLHTAVQCRSEQQNTFCTIPYNTLTSILCSLL